MFICRFIGILNLTICNYILLFIQYDWNIFCKYHILRSFCTNQEPEKLGQKYQGPFSDFQRDVRLKTDAKFLDYAVYCINGVKKKRQRETENRMKKDERVRLDPTIGHY